MLDECLLINKITTLLQPKLNSSCLIDTITEIGLLNRQAEDVSRRISPVINKKTRSASKFKLQAVYVKDKI